LLIAYDANDDDTSKPNDWHISRLHKRSTVFEMIFILNNLLAENREPTRRRFEEVLNEKLALGYAFPTITKLLQKDWQKVRSMSKAMWRKFNKEADHKTYTEFYIMAKLHMKENFI